MILLFFCWWKNGRVATFREPFAAVIAVGKRLVTPDELTNGLIRHGALTSENVAAESSREDLIDRKTVFATDGAKAPIAKPFSAALAPTGLLWRRARDGRARSHIDVSFARVIARKVRHQTDRILRCESEETIASQRVTIGSYVNFLQKTKEISVPA